MAGLAAALAGAGAASPGQPGAAPRRASANPLVLAKAASRLKKVPDKLRENISKAERELIKRAVEDKRYEAYRGKRLDGLIAELEALATRSEDSESSSDSDDEEDGEEKEEKEAKEPVSDEEAKKKIYTEILDKWAQNCIQLCIESWEADKKEKRLQELEEKVAKFEVDKREAHKTYMEELIILKTKMNQMSRQTDRGEVDVQDEDLSFYEPTFYLSDPMRELVKDVIAYKVRLELMRGVEGFEDRTPELRKKINEQEATIKRLRQELQEAKERDKAEDRSHIGAYGRRNAVAPQVQEEQAKAKPQLVAVEEEVKGSPEPTCSTCSKICWEPLCTDCHKMEVAKAVRDAQPAPVTKEERAEVEDGLKARIAMLEKAVQAAEMEARQTKAKVAAAAPPSVSVIGTNTDDSLLQGLIKSTTPPPPKPQRVEVSKDGTAINKELEEQVERLNKENSRLRKELQEANNRPAPEPRTKTPPPSVVEQKVVEVSKESRPPSGKLRAGKKGQDSTWQQFMAAKKRGRRTSTQFDNPLDTVKEANKFTLEAAKRMEGLEMSSVAPSDDDVITAMEEMGNTMGMLVEQLGDTKTAIQEGLEAKEALAAARAENEDLRQKLTAAELALEEMKEKFAEMKKALEDQGMGDVAEKVFEKVGLTKVMETFAPRKVGVFDRLYYDALERARRSGLGFSENVRRNSGPELDAMLEAINKIYRPKHRKSSMDSSADDSATTDSLRPFSPTNPMSEPEEPAQPSPCPCPRCGFTQQKKPATVNLPFTAPLSTEDLKAMIIKKQPSTGNLPSARREGGSPPPRRELVATNRLAVSTIGPTDFRDTSGMYLVRGTTIGNLGERANQATDAAPVTAQAIESLQTTLRLDATVSPPPAANGVQIFQSQRGERPHPMTMDYPRRASLNRQTEKQPLSPGLLPGEMWAEIGMKQLSQMQTLPAPHRAMNKSSSTPLMRPHTRDKAEAGRPSQSPPRLVEGPSLGFGEVPMIISSHTTANGFLSSGNPYNSPLPPLEGSPSPTGGYMKDPPPPPLSKSNPLGSPSAASMARSKSQMLGAGLPAANLGGPVVVSIGHNVAKDERNSRRSSHGASLSPSPSPNATVRAGHHMGVEVVHGELPQLRQGQAKMQVAGSPPPSLGVRGKLVEPSN